MKAKTPVSKLDLDQLRCEHGCEDHEITLHSRCHPDAATWVAYDRRTGLLTVTCAVCDQLIVQIIPADIPRIH